MTRSARPWEIGRWSPRTLDRVERWLIFAFFTQQVLRLTHAAWIQSNPLTMLTLPSEGLVVVLILLRKPAQSISVSWNHWLVAVCGTVLPTLVVGRSASFGAYPTLALLFLTALGLIIQIHAKLSLGKSMGLVAANRGIRRSGPYRFIRHPMYLGYFLGQCAFLMANQGLWNLAILVIATVFQVARIRHEETLLRQDQDYVSYCERVRYRLIPGVF
jgi:protein-S-isoprenylcysteine O-methyltransferase Ste14